MNEPLPVEQLLGRMGCAANLVEPAASRELRRQQVVSRLSDVHSGIMRRRRRSLRIRKRLSWLLVAASLTLAGAALAALAIRPFASPTARGNAAAHNPVPAEKSRTLPVAAAPALCATSDNTVPATPGNPTLAASASASASASAPAPSAGTPSLRGRRPLSSVSPPASSAALSASRASELEAVNQLFAEAKRARREHRDADALLLVERLLSRYPRSVLAHEASVERFRSLARLGRRADASRYAAAYLATFPAGYAAAEAQHLVAGGSLP